MANTLMFEVGVQMAKEQFEAIKGQIEKYNKEWQKDLQIKVEIENLESLTKALSQIGDTSSLRNLRAEIAALNKEFLQLSKGAGGTGSIADRGIAQDIERQSQNIERYTSKIKELTEERSKLVGGVRNVNYESINSEIEKYILMLEGAKKKLQELQEQGNKPIVSANSNAANAFNLEGTAAQEAVEKLNKLVTEKQQVVDAERKLAESSKTGWQTLKEEADNADKTAQSIKGVGKAQKDAADASKKAEKEQAGTVDNLAIKYQTLIARIENWQSSLSKLLAGGDSKYFGAQLNNAIEAYGRALRSAQLGSVFDESGEHLKTLRSVLQLLGVEFANVNKEAKAFNREQEKAANSAWKAHVKDNAAAAKAQANEYKVMQKNAQDARQEAEKMLAAREKMLRSQSESLSKIMSGGKGKLDTYQYDQVRDALRAIRQELREIENAKQRGGLSTGALLSLGGGTSDYSAIIAAYKKFISGKHEAISANNQLTASEQQLASAISHSSQQMRGQSQIISDLKMLATQYLGVWGAQGFLKNVIEIGGQLEMQRLSIGAILQNQAQANDLFNKVKGLATQSPFGVVELDQMTKQLTAYGFKYNELYDMTKRLADISAATGTGVDRLALALGHVRSEAALSGYTLRQFAMGNVPMLQKLSEKLGKSTEEIRKMVRSKQISYDDVVGVLKDLTDEGGMFYNMQEVISESVKAKFKNVRDAMDIMYGEMAEGSIGDALKEVADVLMDVTRNWKDVATVVGSVTGVWVTHRAAILAMNAALGSNTASVIANILSYKQKRAIELQNEALTRKLTADELALVATRKTITAENIRVAMSTNAITRGEALRLVGLRKLSLEEAKALIRSGEFTAAEVRMAMQGRVLGMNLGYAGNMMRYLATSAKMMMASLLTNPWTWIMAGVTTVIELWQRNSREMEQAEELSNKIYEHSQEALKNTRQMLQETGIKVMWRDSPTGLGQFSDVTGNFGQQLGGQMYFELPEFDTSNAEESIERWSQYIRDYAATPNRLLNEAMFDEAGNVRALKDQFDNLKDAVKEVAIAQEQLRAMGDLFENAVNATNSGWFDDSVLTNISDYDKTLRSFGNNIATTYKKFRVNIDIALQSARQQDAAFDKAASGMATYAQQLDLLVRNQYKYARATEVFRNANSASRSTMNELSGDHVVGDAGLANVEAQKATMMADLETFYIQLQADLETKGIKIGSMSEAQQQALLLGYKDKLSSIQGLSVETSNFLMKEFAKRFGIEIDVDDEKFRVKEKEIIRILKELSESDWNVEMNFATNVKDVIDEAQKQYKAAKEYFEKVKPIMLKLGVEFEAGKMLTDEQIEAAVAKADPKARDFIRQALKGVNEATKVYNNAMNASKAGGFSLEDNKKKTPGGRKSEDKDARRLREIVKLYKDAYDWYGKYEKQVGEGSALAKVKEQFEPMFKQFEEQFKQKLSLESIPLYKENLVSLLDEAQKLYESPKHKNSYMVEAIKTIRDAINNVDYEEAQHKMDEYASKVQIELDGLTRAWEIFNNVREATGNVELAVQISGADYAGGKTRNLADALREKIQKDFDAAGGGIAFDMNLSDKDIEESIKQSMPAASQEQIKGLVDEYKKWRDLQRDVLKNDIDVFAKLVGGSKDYESQIQKINDGLEKQVAALNEVAKNNPEKKKDVDKAIGAATAQAEYDKWKLSTQYTNLMNNSLSLTRKEVDEGINVAKQRLNDLMQHNRISAQEYADEMAKIQNIQSEFTKNSFFGSTGAWASGMMGGLSGLRNFYQSQLNSSTIIKSDLENKWKQRGLDRKEWEQYEKASNNITSSSSKLEDLNRLESLTSSFDALAKAIDPVINLFNKLGMTEIGSILGAGQNALQSASSMGIGAAVLTGSATAGMWGAGIGAGLSIAGSIADSLFGGLDDALQKEIEASKQRQKEMENMSKNLETALDRALGGVYNVGNTEQGQKAMADFNKNIDRYRQEIKAREEYETKKAQAEKDLESAKKSGNSFDIIKANNKLASVETDEKMRNWTGAIKYLQETTVDAIKKADETGKYYDMQRASIMVQRDELQHQIDAEEDKKDSDSGAISDMQQQIKELDDQWRNFARDMMQALYDIDVKDWASQFGDTLYEAWKKGEDGAEAFKKKASEIIGNIAKNIFVKRVIETALKPVEDAIIKMMDDTSGELSEKDFTEQIGGLLENSIGKIVPTVNAALDAVDAGLQKEGLPSLKEHADSSLSGNIKGITENTADLLASYLNAIRADVSVNRMELLNIRDNYLKDIKTQITSASSSLHNIENHTAAIMRSNDVIAEKITNLDNNITGLKNRVWQVPVA